MYPYLLEEIFGYNLPMYDIFITVGIFFMLVFVAKRFEKNDGFTRQETNKLLIYLAISLAIALASSYVFDGIFHTIRDQEASFGSITFIGGLIGGVTSFILFVKFLYKADNKTILKIMNTVIIGVILAHAFGRIGCFMAGCCYGIPTDSFLGVVFPYGESLGVKVLPTQLYEAAFLFLFFYLMNNVKKFKNKEFSIYLIGYGVWRFLLEFIRGDDRGSFLGFIQGPYGSYPSPSQYLSLLMIGLGVYLFLQNKKENEKAKLIE